MLIMPVMMAVSVARSIDPRVADLVTAAPGEADTGFTCDTKGLGAYKDFPFGISTFAQVSCSHPAATQRLMGNDRVLG